MCIVVYAGAHRAQRHGVPCSWSYRLYRLPDEGAEDRQTPKPGPLQEQQVLVTSKSLLQPPGGEIVKEEKTISNSLGCEEYGFIKKHF